MQRAWYSSNSLHWIGACLHIWEKFDIFIFFRLDFAVVCTQSTDFHFPELSEQLEKIEEQVIQHNEAKPPMMRGSHPMADSGSVKSGSSESSIDSQVGLEVNSRSMSLSLFWTWYCTTCHLGWYCANHKQIILQTLSLWLDIIKGHTTLNWRIGNGDPYQNPDEINKYIYLSLPGCYLSHWRNLYDQQVTLKEEHFNRVQFMLYRIFYFSNFDSVFKNSPAWYNYTITNRIIMGCIFFAIYINT